MIPVTSMMKVKWKKIYDGTISTMVGNADFVFKNVSSSYIQRNKRLGGTTTYNSYLGNGMEPG
jgi:hypothetical protein